MAKLAALDPPTLLATRATLRAWCALRVLRSCARWTLVSFLRIRSCVLTLHARACAHQGGAGPRASALLRLRPHGHSPGRRQGTRRGSAESARSSRRVVHCADALAPAAAPCAELQPRFLRVPLPGHLRRRVRPCCRALRHARSCTPPDTAATRPPQSPRSALASLHEPKAPTLLNRDQTEEWKGWMQVCFLLYHYFEAREMYNAIRIFIAGYVWMTGFGNFSYYYIRADFSAGRFAQMMWRLNFFVFFACFALNNSYVLYYICPMHTLFTLAIYGALGVYISANRTDWGVALKVGACLVAVLAMWDVPGVFNALWRPFGWLVAYVDPRKPVRTRAVAK
jgi:hypothetical protein